jgi:hypothetical protein
MLLIGAAAAAPAPSHVAPAATISAPVRKDLRCFLLYAAAVGGSQSDGGDDATKSAGSLGVMYFFGKLKSEAPTLDLFPALHAEAIAMGTDPQLKEEGQACDSEFRNAGSQLVDLGSKLQQLAPEGSPAS